MKYDPAMHSPIFGPDEKPVHAGWYVSSYFSADIRSLNIPKRTSSRFWWYWDGSVWRPYKHSAAAILQRRYWFGLREKPEE